MLLQEEGEFSQKSRLKMSLSHHMLIVLLMQSVPLCQRKMHPTPIFQLCQSFSGLYPCVKQWRIIKTIFSIRVLTLTEQDFNFSHAKTFLGTLNAFEVNTSSFVQKKNIVFCCCFLLLFYYFQKRQVITTEGYGPRSWLHICELINLWHVQFSFPPFFGLPIKCLSLMVCFYF